MFLFLILLSTKMQEMFSKYLLLVLNKPWFILIFLPCFLCANNPENEYICQITSVRDSKSALSVQAFFFHRFEHRHQSSGYLRELLCILVPCTGNRALSMSFPQGIIVFTNFKYAPCKHTWALTQIVLFPQAQQMILSLTLDCPVSPSFFHSCSVLPHHLLAAERETRNSSLHGIWHRERKHMENTIKIFQVSHSGCSTSNQSNYNLSHKENLPQTSVQAGSPAHQAPRASNQA